MPFSETQKKLASNLQSAIDDAYTLEKLNFILARVLVELDEVFKS